MQAPPELRPYPVTGKSRGVVSASDIGSNRVFLSLCVCVSSTARPCRSCRLTCPWVAVCVVMYLSSGGGCTSWDLFSVFLR